VRSRVLRGVRRFLLGAAVLLVSPQASPGQDDELAAKSRRAKQAMAAGKFEEAAAIYRELVRAVPGNPGLRLNLGLAQHMAGRSRDAVPHLEAALKLDPNLSPAHLFLGASYLRLSQPSQAVEPLRKFLEADASHKEARQMLADALLSLERYEQSAEQFRRLSELDPRNPKAWEGLGRSYEALAGRAFEELEQTAPESPYWFASIAGARLRQQQYQSAFYFYRQALTRRPALRGVHAELAEIYRQTGHPEWATAAEQKERALGPPDCSTQQLECDFLAGRYRQVVAAVRGKKTAESYYWQSQSYSRLALEAFTRLGELPRSVEIHALMAEIHGSHGRHVEAVKEWRKALELSPHDSSLQKELAISLHTSRDHEAALRLCEALLEREPRSAHLNFLTGDSLLSLQQSEKAIPYLQAAVKYDPQMLAAHAALGRAYVQAGQPGQAVAHLKLALAIDDDGSLHYQLARAYQSAGKRELADQTLRDYQEMQKSAEKQKLALEQDAQITPP
jgi:tetratricopeptide (TPR) repeat protein